MAKFMDKAMNEVILYGGLPMSRANVYRVALEDMKGDGKAADYIAFSPSYKVAPPGTVGMSIEQFRYVFRTNLYPKGWEIDMRTMLPQPKQVQQKATVAEQHQLKIARQTLKMPDAMAGVMGGMTKKQAKKVVARLSR
jgi:hypothetical protein